MCDFYLRVVDAAVSGADTSGTYARYFFIVSNAASWKATATATGKALAKHGALQSAEPRSLPLSQLTRSVFQV